MRVVRVQRERELDDADDVRGLVADERQQRRADPLPDHPVGVGRRRPAQLVQPRPDASAEIAALQAAPLPKPDELRT
ncbi:hypothetical protein Asi02nite_25150 [Asanoa siamensis]|uniref:Uncharacterized protein n=1 Tax=Asanoa siamensis TaxID=926357 RepID=A0ABQ4CQ66_9ACTN|nr:hypothetical protein Asi02nite_25150 [Asanoa siamensis]